MARLGVIVVGTLAFGRAAFNAGHSPGSLVDGAAGLFLCGIAKTTVFGATLHWSVRRLVVVLAAKDRWEGPLAGRLLELGEVGTTLQLSAIVLPFRPKDKAILPAGGCRDPYAGCHGSKHG